MRQFASVESHKKNPFKAIFVAGLVAGTLDAIAAIINYTINGGKTPSRIFQYIASGAIGQKAFTGGTGMVFLGIMFHYAIAFAFTLFFFFIYPKIGIFSKNKVITGLGYGIFVWLVMHFIVIPISNIPSSPFNIKQAIIGVLILMFAIGLPVSLIVSKYYGQANTV